MTESFPGGGHQAECEYLGKEMTAAQSGQDTNYRLGLLSVFADAIQHPERALPEPDVVNVAPSVTVRHARARTCAATILRNECPLYVSHEAKDRVFVRRRRPEEPQRPNLRIVN